MTIWVGVFPLAKLRRFCTAILDEFQTRKGKTDERTQAWMLKLEDLNNMLAFFGSWDIKSAGKHPRILEPTTASLKLLRSRQNVVDIDQELIKCGFDADAIRSSSSVPKPRKMDLPISRSPSVIPLPLGRVVGEATEVVAGCYHKPRCGLWLVREADPSRATLFWTRSCKRGLFYADVGAGAELRLHEPAAGSDAFC